MIGECVEEIRIEVWRKILRIALACIEFMFDCLNALLVFSSGCVDGDGARYWRLI